MTSSKLIVPVFILFSLLSPTHADEQHPGPGYLPLGLQYMMTMDESDAQLSAVRQYRIQTAHPESVSYLVPDPATGTSTGLHLTFHQGALVEVTSGRYKMNRQMFDSYMRQLLSITQQWKSQGVRIITEVPPDHFYGYADDYSYLIVSGGEFESGYKAEVSFQLIQWADSR